MREGVDDRLLQAGASGQHGADLAVRGQGTFRAFRIGEPPGHEPQAAHRGWPGATLRTNRPSISRPEPMTTGAIAAMRPGRRHRRCGGLRRVGRAPRKRRSANWWTVRTSSGPHPIASARAVAIVHVRSAWPSG